MLLLKQSPVAKRRSQKESFVPGSSLPPFYQPTALCAGFCRSARVGVGGSRSVFTFNDRQIELRAKFAYY